MTNNDVHSIVNTLYSEMTGNSDIAEISAKDIVEIGKELSSITTADVIYNKIADKVGKVVIKNKIFTPKLLNIFRDGWEYGSILETLRVKPYSADTDLSIKPTTTDYSADLFTPVLGEVIAKYFDNEISFRFKYSRPTDQLWQAFRSYEDMGKFLGAIEISVTNSLNVRLLSLQKTAINNMIAQTLYADISDGNYSTHSTSRCINVLKLYNDSYGTTLTADNCRKNADFLKFFVKTVMNTRDRLTDMSKIFNIDGVDTFSNEEDLNLVILSTVANDVKVNMQSDVYHKDLVELPNYSTVPYWQASGTAYDEGVIGEIEVKIEDVNNDGAEVSVEATGILGILFDSKAVGITCEHRKTTSQYIANADVTNFFDSYRARYFNSFDENFVVFYVA